MRALVTGATGFLGSRLTRELLERGNSVAILARQTSSYREIADVVDRVRIYLVDERPETLQHAIASELPDVVFHLATYYKRDHQSADLAPLLEANVAFPLRLVDAMANHGLKRFINTASAWQYFEQDTYRPVCLHSACKQAFETLLRYYVDTGSIDCITLVMHDTYGPGDPRRKIFSLLNESVATSAPLKMSAGEQIVNLVHVRDAVAAYNVAAQRLIDRRGDFAHEVYSISGGQPRSLRQLVVEYLRYARRTVPIEWGARPNHEREVMQPWQGGATLPGWSARVDIETGLREMAQAAFVDNVGRDATQLV